MKVLIATVSAALLAGPLAAQNALVTVPDRCTAVATIHKNSCVVTTVMKCDAGTWQALTYQNGVAYSVVEYDRDWAFNRWSFLGERPAEFTMVPGSGASMNIRDLIDIGDTPASGQFALNTNVITDKIYTLSGETEANGRIDMIEDEQFIVFEANRLFEPVPGEGGLAYKLDILVSLQRELVIEGAWSRNVFGNGNEVFDHAPRAISERGEDGFLAMSSQFGCK